MKHIDWLNPDHIILSNKKNSTVYKEFTKAMRSRSFSELRLLETKSKFYIRYILQNQSFWFGANILQKKGKDYYIELDIISDVSKDFENKYISLNREEKIDKLLE